LIWVRVASREAWAAADGRVAYLAARGPRALLDEAARLVPDVIPRGVDPDLPYEAWAQYADVPGRRWAGSAFGVSWAALAASGAFGPAWAVVMDRLRVAEAAERLPGDPYRFRSVGYGSPLVLEVLSGSGTAALGLGYLLGVIRDWRPRRRVMDAVAADVESQAWMRHQFRRTAVERLADGSLELTSEMVSELLSDQLVDAMARLAARAPELEQSPELPEGG
jgi:hypothetical protein